MAEPPDWIDTSRFTYDKADTSSSDEDSSSPSRLVIDAASAGIALLDTPTSDSPSYASSDHHVFFPLATSPSQALRSLNASSPNQINEVAVTTTTVAMATGNTTVGQAVSFLGATNITVTEGGTERMDRVCLYTYQWGSISLDIVATTAADSASIPMRDMYDKVIPDIKRNVLSSRMSKIGVHSHALLEPYVVALRKLGLGASARSHYIKVADFVKLCQYYHRIPPEGLSSFSVVTSESPVEVVIKMAENDEASFDTQRSDVVEVPYVPLGGRKESVELAASSNYSPSPHQTLSFISADASAVDGRDLVLPSGIHVTLLVREEEAYVSNQELCKIIPNINRNVMETIRNTYGIMVYPATKAEISLLKWIGVLGMKAGRALLYKITDVAKMFGYWHLPVSPVVKELCDGKIPTKKLDTSSAPPTPRQDPVKASPNTSYPSVSPYSSWTQGDSSFLPSRSTPLTRTSLDPSGPQSTTLTPEMFQKPVQFLSSLQNQQELSSGVGGVGSRVYGSPFQQTSVQIHTSGTRGDLPSPKRRRMSGGDVAPLDDQDLEYMQLKWGDHNLTLLCPSKGEPYLAVPEFFNKILGHRSSLSVQRKEKLGVVTIPATSVQIHTLRVHGSLDAFAGGVKLISFNSALKLAADSNVDVPRSVYEEYEKYSTKAATLHTTQPPGGHYQGAQAYSSQRNSTPNSTTMMTAASVVPRLSQKVKVDEVGSPGEMTSQAFWDPKTVPSHPSVVDLGPAYRMSDGVICHVKWADQLVVIYTSSRRINYVGLFQIYQMVFKQFVSRMNFKMRMRKLDVRSIRAPSAIRLKMIELDALPPHSPVCGLIKVNEMERLARSYGVTPPPVFYEVFMARQSKAGKRLPHSLEEGGGGEGVAAPEGGQDGMVVSISRQLVRVDNPAQMVTAPIGAHSQPHHSSSASSSSFKPSTLQTLAKKITQRHRKYSAGVSMVRVCPACHKVNPSLKKRCQYCSMFLIGRACSSCGTLNHNRAKDCLKCHTAILPLQPGQPNGTPMVTLSALSSSADIQSSSHYALPYPEDEDMEVPLMDGGEEGGEPSSPSFSAPPIRSAVLKSLFPGQPQKEESAQVMTKTVYSGNLMASRQCMECGQLNSKMAKKCVQCRSPLQGRACPRCNRPNHNHSTECYKCGGPLPPTASRWVYTGMKGHRGSGHHGGSGSSRLLEGAETRAPIGCIRCFKLRMNSRLKCGRCGDVFHTKPLYPSEHDDDEEEEHGGLNSPIKDEKAAHSTSFLLDLARNLVCLGIEEQLVPIINTVEGECRIRVCSVEEEYNDVEEEYQTLLARKDDKTSEYKDLEAELGGLIRQLETQQTHLDKLVAQEKDAKLALDTYPNRISVIEQKIVSSDQLISTPLIKEEVPHLC